MGVNNWVCGTKLGTFRHYDSVHDDFRAWLGSRVGLVFPSPLGIVPRLCPEGYGYFQQGVKFLTGLTEALATGTRVLNLQNLLGAVSRLCRNPYPQPGDGENSRRFHPTVTDRKKEGHKAFPSDDRCSDANRDTCCRP